jgi:hypothetical protein
VVQNGGGEIDGMLLEAVETEVREEAAVLGRKRISLAVMAYLRNSMAILPRALCKIKSSYVGIYIYIARC